MYYEDGAVYEGEWLRGYRHGNGMLRLGKWILMTLYLFNCKKCVERTCRLLTEDYYQVKFVIKQNNFRTFGQIFFNKFLGSTVETC